MKENLNFSLILSTKVYLMVIEPSLIMILTFHIKILNWFLNQSERREKLRDTEQYFIFMKKCGKRETSNERHDFKLKKR